MKTVGVRDLQAHLGRVLEDVQGEAVVVMRHSRPIAVILGVEDATQEALDRVLQRGTSAMDDDGLREAVRAGVRDGLEPLRDLVAQVESAAKSITEAAARLKKTRTGS